MVRPVLNPGRLLEPVSDCWPRGMTVHDRTRLTGQLPRQNPAQRQLRVFRPVYTGRSISSARSGVCTDRQAILLAHEGAVAAGQALHFVAFAGGGDGAVNRLQIGARPVNRQRLLFARLQIEMVDPDLLAQLQAALRAVR